MQTQQGDLGACGGHWEQTRLAINLVVTGSLSWCCQQPRRGWWQNFSSAELWTKWEQTQIGENCSQKQSNSIKVPLLPKDIKYHLHFVIFLHLVQDDIKVQRVVDIPNALKPRDLKGWEDGLEKPHRVQHGEVLSLASGWSHPMAGRWWAEVQPCCSLGILAGAKLNRSPYVGCSPYE